MTRSRLLLIVLIAGSSIAALWTISRHDPVRLEANLFTDITFESGLPASYRGMTYGAAWADIDVDGLPDLYVTNHLNPAILFRNLGNGRFADVSNQWFAPDDLGGDKHGAAWADFDNDGRPDLMQLTGAEAGVGAEAKRLFMNRGSRFENVAEAAGVANPFGRTRMPLWLDLDADGQLDVFHGAEARFDDRAPPFVFVQRSGKFQASPQAAAFSSRSAPFCVLTQLTARTATDVLCRVPQKGKTAQVFTTGRIPMAEHDLIPATAFDDVAAGDFDNDGWIDLFLARKNPASAVSFGHPAANELVIDTWIDPANAEKLLGFNFVSTGRLEVEVAPVAPGDAISPERIHIGAKGEHPGALRFALAPGVDASPAFKPGGDAGIHIGGKGGANWQVLVSAALERMQERAPRHQQVAMRIRSTEPITHVEAIGAKPAEEAPARLFMNHGGTLIEESDRRGVNERLVAGVNVATGDFNNDMHLDLFVVASGEIGKQENVLLLNRGGGRFDAVPGAGGAAGDTLGVGDSVTVADFDNDGFLDLLVTSGGSMGRSFGLPASSGGYRLYRNSGNANNWLHIDLEGTKTNRDGIGARVEISAGGVRQVRIQDGGVHHRGQNHMRLHFGLAKHAQADSIVVRWPSGTVQELTGVKANQILRIKEP